MSNFDKKNVDDTDIGGVEDKDADEQEQQHDHQHAEEANQGDWGGYDGYGDMHAAYGAKDGISNTTKGVRVDLRVEKGERGACLLQLRQAMPHSARLPKPPSRG